MKKCPKCNSSHTKSGRFCSRSCANSRGPMSDSQKKLRSEWMKNNPIGWYKTKTFGSTTRELIAKTCLAPECQKTFIVKYHRRDQKYCSIACWNQCSGTHPAGKSFYGKTGWYKEFWCHSRYELAYIIFCLDTGLKIERNNTYWRYEYKGKIRRYYPDFRVNGKLVEIKGWHSELIDIKLAAVDESITILYGKDLQLVFKHVYDKTGLKLEELHQLYEKT